ncbi:hypothetical protein J5N97_026141 [Dioscorea zingiberensis]|uniref:Uncharacterized protein n=1 Tax=Dioscorea zingiberensis TaxID=325984 RepID=A0A9D5C2F7_9LILI|nr:hypothetical protein J5N97_026141 [Dioscorea zingiberensis]
MMINLSVSGPEVLPPSRCARADPRRSPPPPGADPTTASLQTAPVRPPPVPSACTLDWSSRPSPQRRRALLRLSRAQPALLPPLSRATLPRPDETTTRRQPSKLAATAPPLQAQSRSEATPSTATYPCTRVPARGRQPPCVASPRFGEKSSRFPSLNPQKKVKVPRELQQDRARPRNLLRTSGRRG